MTDTVRNERAALSRYFAKHFVANPPINQEWFTTEVDGLDAMLRHDQENYSYADWQKRIERFCYRPDHYPNPD